MLYKQNRKKVLSDELFRSPTAEYRGTPFWSWNCDLNEKELLWQIEILKEMGFGGFHMHCRAGMSTEYLSEDFMKLVKACVKKAKKEKMLAWLYDEDRWPSGFAGGIVTRDKEYRGRFLAFSPTPPKENEAHIDFGAYDVVLDENGALKSYRRLKEGEEAEGRVWYAYESLLTETPRFNNQTYVDTLNKKAIDRFIEVTYDAYRDAVGRDFGKTVPAIFTDEPQFSKKEQLAFATTRKAVKLPFTDDLEETYKAEYGESLLDHLPELLWDLPHGEASVTRYRYHAHVAKRFAEAFADNVGAWCKENGIALTGHMMSEPTLKSQTGMLGEAMPSYRGFQIPGIDMLCARFELNTAKQCQSATRQYRREGMMSELYGVTGWDFDFRGHKLNGDWQAAMGVTVRVPHLSWVSMEGEAKRDYPASLHYQSPWYRKYSAVEDHFARLNTALTRGKPVVRVGVIHPIESYWLHFGTLEQNALRSEQLENNFAEINRILTFGGYDFDYICESTFMDQTEKGGKPLKVGAMKYDAVVVPACETLRKTTVERLEAFQKAGGLLIFMGEAPKLMDARPSDRPAALYEKSKTISFERASLLEALKPVSEVTIHAGDGSLTKDVLYQMREDGDYRWLFLAKGNFPYNKDVSEKTVLHVKLPAHYAVNLYDTMTGEIRPLSPRYSREGTEIITPMYDYDSFLFRLEEIEELPEALSAPQKDERKAVILETENAVPFTLGEPNALLLDQAEYSLDGESFRKREEILRLDTECRKRLGFPVLSGSAAQPWCIEEEKIEHHLRLRFRFQSTVHVNGILLALEHPERTTVIWNHQLITARPKGYYVDKSIKCLKLPFIRKGENILELSMPFGKRTATEWCYVLGNFGVNLMGSEPVIVPMAEKLGYSNITAQTLPFYSGTLDYQIETKVPPEWDGGELELNLSAYRAACIEVLVDGEEKGLLIYPPYRVSLGSVASGPHTVILRAYIPRTNGFGPVHLADEKYYYPGPKAWRTDGELFGYEYYLYPEGILKKPILTCKKISDRR